MHTRATIPLLTAFMGIVILKEKIRPATWIAMTIALIGITGMEEMQRIISLAASFVERCTTR